MFYCILVTCSSLAGLCATNLSFRSYCLQSTATALRDLESPLGQPALKLDLNLDGASCAELLAERDASFSGSGDSMHSGFTGVYGCSLPFPAGSYIPCTYAMCAG